MSYDIEELRRAMRRGRASDADQEGSAVHALAALRVVFSDGGFPSDVADLLEIEGWLRPRPARRSWKKRSLDARATRRRLRRHFDKLQQHEPPRRDPLVSRLDRLAQVADLGVVERELLVLAAVPFFERLASRHGRELRPTRSPPLLEVLSVALGRPREELAAALAPTSALRRTELIELDCDAPSFRLGELARDWLHQDLDDEALEEVSEILPTTTLSLADFAHVGLDAEILRDHLRASLAAGIATTVGVVGPPQSGRTTLVRAIAGELDATVVRVRRTVAALTPADLLRLRIARDAASARVLLLIEADDGDARFDPIRRRRRPRRVMDEGSDASLAALGVPVIHMLAPREEPAEGSLMFMMPREPAPDHDLTVEVPALPESARLRALTLAAGLEGQPPPSWLTEAAARGASPSAVAKHAKAVRAMGHADRSVADRQLAHLVSREGKAPRLSPPTSALAYDPTWLRADVPVERLLAAMERSPRGRILMYGEPGTGKSRLARELARRGGLEVVTRTGSELLSRWVGGTEKNLAAAFEEATRRRALLVLDEVDSFLSARRGALRSYEVTQVNELLVQIESFRGWLVCTTNFREGLDEAALRRFPIKVELLPPDEWQRRALFDAALRALEVPEGANERATIDRILTRLTLLTPGDVAAVVEQAQILGDVESGLALAERLAREVSLKGASKRKAGFG